MARFFLFFGIAFFISLWAIPIAAAATFTGSVKTGTYWAHAIETQHFHFEFSDAVYDGTDTDNSGVADILERTANFAEDSWTQEITNMGYASPVDVSAGEKLVLFLDDTDEYLVPNSLGVTSVLSDGSTIYMAVDPTLEDSLLDVTIAHEFFHAITFGYEIDFVQTYQDLSFAEASATWMEDQVFDDSNSYVDYLPYFFSEPDYSLFAGVLPADSLYEYGLNLWPRFLSEKFGAAIIQTVWLNFFASSDGDGFDNIYNVYLAFKDAIEAEDANFVDIFQEFRVWNYDLSEYEEGDLYPSVSIASKENDYPLSNQSVGSSNWPALFGTNYLEFSVGSETGDFEFILTKSSDVSFALTLLPLSSTGKVDVDAAVDAKFLMGTSGGSLVFPDADHYTKIIAIVSPVEIDFDTVTRPQDAFDQGYQYFYSADFGDFVSTTTTTTINTNTLPTIENVHIINQTDSGVILGWNRVVDDTVVGYKVYYGTESGAYTESLTLNSAVTTRKTVSDLTTGQTYYFAVKAIDADGAESDDYSEEVSATFVDQLFSDVSVTSSYDTAIRYLSSIGVLEGYADGTFKPNSTVNRAEMLKIILEAKGITPDTGRYANCFPDVTTEWYAPYVCYAAHVQWVEGYGDGFFRPANTVNKAEALKMVLNAFRFDVSDASTETSFSDVGSTEWYAPYVSVAEEYGVLEESGIFDGSDGRTRAEIAEEVFRVLVVTVLKQSPFTDALASQFLQS